MRRRRLTFGLLAIGLMFVFAASAHGANGTFDRAWGKNVISGGATGFEICTVASSCQAGEFSTDLGGELDTPWGAATDSAGNVYVTDTSHNRIQKFDSSGNFLRAWGTDVVSTGPDDTLAGDFEICVASNGDTCKGAAASTGLGGDLRAPGGLATDPAGNVYVANSDNNRIEKYDSAGNFLRTWGEDVIDPASPGNTGVGPEICVAGVDTCKRGLESGEGGAVNYPQGVASDGAGNVYEASDGNSRVDKFDSSGAFQRAWGKDVDAPGSADDTGTGFEICSPADGDACQLGDSGGLAGEFDVPRGIGADAAGNTYVAEQNNNRIQKFNSSGTPLRAWGKDVIDPASTGNTGTGFEVCVAGVNTCQAGTSGGLGGEMNEAFSAATDQAGNVYVADRFNSRIQRFSSSGNFQRAWGEDVASSGPGNTGTGFEICVAGADICKTGTHVAPAQGGELNLPPGLATDAAGSLYVADAENSRIQKFADPIPPGGGGGPTAAPPAPAPHAKKCKKHKRSAGAAKKKCKKKKKK